MDEHIKGNRNLNLAEDFSYNTNVPYYNLLTTTPLPLNIARTMGLGLNHYSQAKELNNEHFEVIVSRFGCIIRVKYRSKQMCSQNNNTSILDLCMKINKPKMTTALALIVGEIKRFKKAPR